MKNIFILNLKIMLLFVSGLVFETFQTKKNMLQGFMQYLLYYAFKLYSAKLYLLL